MYSSNLQEVAKKLGYWDGKEPMKFWKVIGPWRKAFDMREYYILSTLAPSLKLSDDVTVTELPFSVCIRLPFRSQDNCNSYRDLSLDLNRTKYSCSLKYIYI